MTEQPTKSELKQACEAYLREQTGSADRAKWADWIRNSPTVEPRHTYKAKANDDGTYDIMDVDIFEECRRPKPGLIDDWYVFDAEWLQAAAERSRELEAGGYLMPVGAKWSVSYGRTADEFAGFARNMRVVGERLVVDIVGIPPVVFERIRDFKLPYRSVAIRDANVLEITELVLMDFALPWFKLPLLDVELVEVSDE